ncbi:hypothetical protein ACHAWF_014111 [Thalassiosira exigua]
MARRKKFPSLPRPGKAKSTSSAVAAAAGGSGGAADAAAELAGGSERSFSSRATSGVDSDAEGEVAPGGGPGHRRARSFGHAHRMRPTFRFGRRIRTSGGGGSDRSGPAGDRSPDSDVDASDREGDGGGGLPPPSGGPPRRRFGPPVTLEPPHPPPSPRASAAPHRRGEEDEEDDDDDLPPPPTPATEARPSSAPPPPAAVAGDGTVRRPEHREQRPSEPRPGRPPRPTRPSSAADVRSEPSDAAAAAARLPYSRSRSLTPTLTPSDVHYHTSASGGCNAPLVPLERHYKSNDALRDLFSTLCERDENSRVAYAVGLRFVEVALFQIPQHGYYEAGGEGGRRASSAADAVRVTEMLGDMVQDEEEEERERREEVRRLRVAAKRSLEEALRGEGGGEDGGDAFGWTDNLCSFPDNLCSFWSSGKKNRYGVDDAVANQDDRGEDHVKKRPRVDRGSLPRPPEPVVLPQVFIRRDSDDEDGKGTKLKKPLEDIVAREDPRPPLPKKVSDDDHERGDAPVDADLASKTAALSTEDGDSRKCDPPSSSAEARVSVHDEVTPLARGSYADPPARADPLPGHLTSSGFDREQLELAMSLSASLQDGGSSGPPTVVSASSDEGGATIPRDPASGRVASLSDFYEEKYLALRDRDVFHVRFLDTFQGRNPASTNGCTVIAPLTCVQYFTSRDQNRPSSPASRREPHWHNGIPDDLVNHVIDEHAAAILPEVRGKLNLGRDAFIVPSDVHDHLIDVGLLSTSQFVGVCGGNVLDDDHLNSFRSCLLLLDDERERERLKGRRVGATFFFHGHVVALHVVDAPGGRGEKWIEFIDSLPNPETWVGRRSSRHSSRHSSDASDRRLRPLGVNGDEEWESMSCGDDDLPLNAVRVRCTDAEHFDVLVRHYACSKFSDEEQRFIDATEWEDNNGYDESAFDPRVFQAFIWCEAE